MEHLFAYGTLMCGSIMREVSGFDLPAVPGTLKGYCRRSVKGELYPAIMPYRGGCVEGVIYRCVPGLAWERLDRFEGEMYVRKRVRISLSEGTAFPAATYVVQPGFEHCLGRSDWDFGEFLLEGKASFQRYYKGYLSL